MWVQDEAGPYQAIPQAGTSWQPEGQPQRQSHEYVRGGTAKLLTLFHPATGELRAKGVTRCTNAVLHPWLEGELSAILAALPLREPNDGVPRMEDWNRWAVNPSWTFKPDSTLPPLRMLLVLDNLAGHKTPCLVRWLLQHGILPLYTPLGGSWLNMAESIQRIIVRRALSGQNLTSSEQVIEQLEATVRGWNRYPTPFVWGGKRKARRERARARGRALGGSGAQLPAYANLSTRGK